MGGITDDSPPIGPTVFKAQTTMWALCDAHDQKMHRVLKEPATSCRCPN